MAPTIFQETDFTQLYGLNLKFTSFKEELTEP